MPKNPIEALEGRQMLAAEAYDWRAATIKANGFINGIVYSPTTPGLSYINTDMGGAYRYDASRAKWTNLTDFAQYNDSAGKHMGVETLAIDPTDADRVYLGLGTYMQNSAVLRSSDRGQTWSRTNVPFQMNGNGSGRNTGQRMRVDPNSPNILYYGTRDDGLFRSTDRAATWTKVNSFPTVGLDSGFGADTGILFVEFDKASGAGGTATPTIYVGVFDATAGATRVYRSGDAGATWAALPGGQPTAANLFPQRAALTPDGSALYITYATSTSYPGPYGVGDGAVYKVTNPRTATPAWADVSPPVGYAFSAVTLDPTNPSTVYVSEMGNYNPADRIWRSTNAGASWASISPNSNRDDSSAPYARTSKVHWLGDLQIDPLDRNVAMFTTGYGLYRTANLTAAQPAWTFFNEGFEQSAVLEFASPNGGPVNLISAIGDRDGYRHADFDVSPAEGVLGSNTGLSRGTSPDIDVAWNDHNRLVRLVKTAPYVQASADNGVTWTWLNATGVSGGGDGSLALSADGSRVIYEPSGAGRLIYSTRTGNAWSTWTSPASNAPADGSDLTVDLVDGNTFYARAGTTISRSTDGGLNWTVMTTTAPSNIRRLRAVIGNAGHLIAVANNNGVQRSTDGGATWTRLAASAVTDAYAIGVGAAAPGGNYPALFIAGTVAGATGFHRSDDAGATWKTISDADHQYGYVTVIQGDPRVFGRLYIGTNGRGIVVAEPLKAAGLLPPGWTAADVGAPAIAGGADGNAGGAFTLVGTGTGLANAADQFQLTSTAAGGDATIVARVASVSGPSGNARAGVTLRASAAANSAFASVEVLDDGTVRFVYRASAGSAVVASSPMGEFASAKFVRIIRTGDSFAGAYSLDGVTWTTIGSQTIAMPTQVRAGLTATGRDAATLAKASVTNVVVTSDVVAPAVTAISFDFATRPVAVRATFSEDVIASLTAGDLSISLASGGPAITPAAFTVDPATLGVRFDLPADLAAGDYVATLSSFSDAAGNAGADATLAFFHLPGDVNRDRVVGFDDLLALAQNYGRTTPAVYADGDLTADGLVDFDDLLLLAQSYGTGLPLAQATLVAPQPKAGVAARSRRPSTAGAIVG